MHLGGGNAMPRQIVHLWHLLPALPLPLSSLVNEIHFACRRACVPGGWNRERWHEDSAARLDLRNLRLGPGRVSHVARAMRQTLETPGWESLPSPVGEAGKKHLDLAWMVVSSHPVQLRYCCFPFLVGSVVFQSTHSK